MNQFGELGYTIWDIEFGDHSSALERERNALLISGYLEANLGQLNTLINTDFTYNASGDMVEPALQQEEKAIFTQLYLKDYLQKQSRNILRNASNTSPITDNQDWSELREGDSYIKRNVASPASKNTSAKLLQELAKEANEILTKMIHSYNMYGSVPTQIAGKDAAL